MASGNQVIEQLRGMVSDLSTKQKLVLVGGAVLTIGTLLFFVRTLSKPDLKPLYTNMEPADAQSLAQRLTEKRIVYELTADGRTISVPAEKLDAARLELASEGMPHSGRLGFELFDKMNWGETEFDEKVNYQRALEGELERTIQKLRNVESVRVHLVMPTDSLFVDRARGAKASVILNLRYGRITPDMQLAIARLVSGAVDQLAPENVTIIDADDDRPSRLAEHDPGSAAGGLESEMSTRILDTLTPVIGPDSVRASVNVEYDSSTSEENQETYDPKLAVAVSTQRSDEQVGGGGTGGIPGTTSNVPGASANAKTTAAPGESFQTSHSEASSYAVSKVVRRIVQPAGRIRRVTAAVVVDDAAEITAANGKKTSTRRKRTPEELKQIEQLASAAIGLDTNRGDSLTVQNLSFQKPEVEAPPKPGAVERVRVTLTDWSALIRYATVLLLFVLAYLLLLRPVKKQALLAFKDFQSRAALKADASRAENNQLSPGQQALALKQRLIDKVKAEPAAAGQLVQNLLRGDRP